ncbi:MAG: CHAP domain-containing protein [Rhodospirillales bacterium]|nr:CHAP domain-containing protein [Rhodospirillales bacterium]MDE2319513.1 CHAP domain-containing protein [Rhodospirillales bacterium]
MAADKASCLSFCNAARAWLAGVSIAVGAVLLPVQAQASVHHASTHHVVTHRALIHVATRHENFAHHALPAHRLARVISKRAVHLAWNTHHVTHHYTRVARYTHTRHYTHLARDTHTSHYTHYTHVAAEFRYSRLQCVPYAREVSHIDLSGNAFLWWAEAAGRYGRGNTPAVGAVLNFRSISRMPLGHVAVVTAVLDPRTILVTQANWVPGSITNDVTVQDVSADNDWTDVKVELGDGATMGSAYPTYGFIYNHADDGTVIASGYGGRNEVAEAPAASPVASEAPDRNLQ